MMYMGKAVVYWTWAPDLVFFYSSLPCPWSVSFPLLFLWHLHWQQEKDDLLLLLVLKSSYGLQMEKIRKAGVTIIAATGTNLPNTEQRWLWVSQISFPGGSWVLVPAEKRTKGAYEQEKKQTKSLTKQLSTSGKKKWRKEKDFGLSSG